MRINVPTEGTENDDKNPARSAPRNLFHGDGYRWTTRLTVINVTEKEVLYNFLSTFSGGGILLLIHAKSPRILKASHCIYNSDCKCRVEVCLSAVAPSH